MEKMDKIHKEVLQMTKEIVVKFVEAGKISTSNFSENFPKIYSVIFHTINNDSPAPVANKEKSK